MVFKTYFALLFSMLSVSCGDGVVTRITPPPAGRGLLTLECGHTHALVHHEEKLLGGCSAKQSQEIILKAGIYYLTLSAPGHYTQYRKVTVSVGEEAKVQIELLKAPE